jgi:hypothetical protein
VNERDDVVIIDGGQAEPVTSDAPRGQAPDGSDGEDAGTRTVTHSPGPSQSR